MAKSLNADLLTAQTTGYPTGGFQPAVRCKFHANTIDGEPSHDYSFDPTVTTNRLQHVQHIEDPQNDSGVILLSNNNKSVPVDLRGYLVHLGWGLNTASGIKNNEASGAVAPALWVLKQSDISGAPKGQQNELYTVFELRGVWQAILNAQPIRLGATPYFWSNISPAFLGEGVNNIPELANKTVFECLEYLIETSLSEQTGLGFYLDALGDQDDGLINDITKVNPFPTDGVSLLYDYEIEPFGTYGAFINKLLALTNCRLRTQPSLTFKIIYPQDSDSVDETYYSDMAVGHPFYEVNHSRIEERSSGTPLPNHIQIWGGEDEMTGLPLYSGNWFDSDHYSTEPTSFDSAAIEAAYTGAFMPVTFEGDELTVIWERGFVSNAQCAALAASLGIQMRANALGTRVIIPMDARVELFDRVKTVDTRGA
ncbi:hypothetical protein LCGC14_1943560 [marine sediment metagenome]|uniref:Uncharacterized protein n=1 Tax=marine sediment metagenome TaxID=412755 RepID=A0A0F9HXX0_9ZZZZ